MTRGGGSAHQSPLPEEREMEALDSYSSVVTAVADLLIPSVASLEVSVGARGQVRARGQR